MSRDANARERRLAEGKIFQLRKKAARFLQVGDVEEFNRIQNAISDLQEIHGIVLGRGKGEHDDRTA